VERRSRGQCGKRKDQQQDAGNQAHAVSFRIGLTA
jgi:hypothetical protein